MEDAQNIGAASTHSGVSVKMIRHYESIGLLPRARRSTGNYRVYAENEVHLLRFIKRARTLGFPIDDIRELVGLWKNRSRPSAAVKKIAGRHVDELKRKVAELESMIGTLDHLVKHCHGDHRPDCPILDDLAQSGRRNPSI
jgi:MerR family copper efflux transcriptional regulator